MHKIIETSFGFKPLINISQISVIYCSIVLIDKMGNAKLLAFNHPKTPRVHGDF